MAKPYSMDLRERVIEAIEREGLSCSRAAARFEVAISTTIERVNRYRQGRVPGGGVAGGARPRASALFDSAVARERPCGGHRRFPG